VLTTLLPARGDSGPGELLCFAERSTQHDQAQCSDDEPDVVLIDLIDLDVVLVEHHKRLLTVNGHVQGLLDSTGSQSLRAGGVDWYWPIGQARPCPYDDEPCVSGCVGRRAVNQLRRALVVTRRLDTYIVDQHPCPW
jgi:hypothetical protein